MFWLELLWKPVLLIVLLFGGYEYIRHGGMASQKAKDDKVITSLKVELAGTQLSLDNASATITKIAKSLDDEKHKLQQQEQASSKELAKVEAEKKEAAKQRDAINKKYKHDIADPKLAKLLSPDCEVPHDPY